eukprot:493802-Pleurochrysis_carterae.AAC.1
MKSQLKKCCAERFLLAPLGKIRNETGRNPGQIQVWTTATCKMETPCKLEYLAGTPHKAAPNQAVHMAT